MFLLYVFILLGKIGHRTATERVVEKKEELSRNRRKGGPAAMDCLLPLLMNVALIGRMENKARSCSVGGGG